MVRGRLAGHGLIEPAILPLARSCLFVGEMDDWGWSIGLLLLSGPVLKWAVLSIVGLDIVYAVFVGFSLEGTAVVELTLLLKGCHWSAIGFGSFYRIFVWSILPGLSELTG